MAEEEDVPTRANQIVETLRKGKQLHDQFTKAFEGRYQIAGKLLHEWKEHFKVVVPPDLVPAQCREFSSQILDLYQEATFHKAAAEARYQSMKGSGASSFRKAFAAIVAEYKEKGMKLPSKDTLENLAKEEGCDIEDALVHGELECNFWKTIISSLDVARKIIDTCSISLSVEAKALQADRYFAKGNE